MNSGYIKIYRSLLKWEWYDDINTCRLFLHLLLTVNYTDGQWHGMTIKAGSRVCSIRKLSIETGLTEKEVRTALKHLENTGEVAKQGQANYSIISIKNFTRFQSEGEPTANKRRTNGEQTASQGQTEGERRATIEEGKKVRREEYTPHNPPTGEQGERLTVEMPRGAEESADHSTTPVSKNEERFNRWWAVYPKKVGKGAARKSWDKIKPSDDLTARMIAAVRQQAQSDQWRRDGGQYIPNPATWLNQGRWEDEVKVSTPPAGGFGVSYDLDRFRQKAAKPPVYQKRTRGGDRGDQY